MEYYISSIDFINVDDVENREVIVTLNNGTEVHICACYESWEQYNGTTPELATTVDIADCVNEWLHGIGDIPGEAYDYINDPEVVGEDDEDEPQVFVTIQADKSHLAEFFRYLADQVENYSNFVELPYGCAEFNWPDC